SGAGRRLAWAASAVLTLHSTLQFVWQDRRLEPRRLSPAVVRALRALERQTSPGDVVMVKPERQRLPPPPLIIGRRVPFTRFIPFFSQLAPRPTLIERYERTSAFFATPDSAEAQAIARELHAKALLLVGGDEVRFPKDGLLEPLFDEDGVRLYRISPVPLPRR